ncbi:MAG: peptidoglycan-binding protein [Oscillospiraceae bacterium]|nr:peptidoglycan-binding protein [Oscillospiraceae bacterium]
MREDVFLLGRPIESLQTMLQQLSYGHKALPFLVPDGRFGEETLEAVMVFQREFGLPVTGRVDPDTWAEVVRRYDGWMRERAKPDPLRAFPVRPFQLEIGDRDDVAVVVQTLFGILSGVVDGIGDGTRDGWHSGMSVDNVMWLQKVSGLPVTGVMDKETWNRLARLYDLLIVRRRELEREAPQTALEKK